MDLKKFAASLPYPIQQPLRYIYGAIPPSIRYGKAFRETYAFLQESQWWSREKLEEYQMQQLSKLLHHAYENVPYYRRVFDERGLKPRDIQDFDDLRKLPYLTKDMFKSNFGRMVATNVKLKSLTVNHTSGTTGKPIQFYEGHTATQKEIAFIFHQWSHVGYKPEDARVELRGAVNKKKPADYNPAHKVLRLSPCIDNKEVALYYLERMRSFGAGFLHGYPGAIASFAHAIKKYGLAVPFKLKAVLFASETVYDWEREITKEVFDCRVFSHYGMAEKAVLAAECERSNYYHCFPQYGVTEIDHETHEIIGTGFINDISPFIRYRTTDVASAPFLSKCEHCGREYFPVFEKVEGRLEDFIVTPQGMLITPAIITHPFKDLKTIKDTQVIQKSHDHIILRAVPWERTNPGIFRDELDRLCRDLQEIIGHEVRIDGEVTEDIGRQESGKFKWIQSEVSKDSLERGVRET